MRRGVSEEGWADIVITNSESSVNSKLLGHTLIKILMCVKFRI